MGPLVFPVRGGPVDEGVSRTPGVPPAPTNKREERQVQHRIPAAPVAGS
ncbi:hypothetical protein PV779_22175 [Streptomyces sp. ID01-9D]|nr:hypothetical protein [Streptomyces sp. ID01-9D]